MALDESFIKFKLEGEALELKGKALMDYIKSQREVEAEKEAKKLEAEKELKRIELEKEQIEAEKEARKLEAENEQKRIAMESEARRIAAEQEDKRLEAEEYNRNTAREAESHNKAREYEHLIELKRMELEAAAANPSRATTRVETGTKVKMPFLNDRDDVEAYLVQFERVATMNRWEEEQWATRLVPLLTGNAREAYIQMPVEQSSNYQDIKTTLLRRHQLSATTYRKKFRSAKPREGEQNDAYFGRLDHMMKLWIQMSEKEEKDLKELLLIEKFVETQTTEKARFIRERRPKDKSELIDVANLFDDTRAAEMRSFPKRHNNFGFHNRDQNQREQKPEQGSNSHSSNNRSPHKEEQKNRQTYTQNRGSFGYQRGPPQIGVSRPSGGCYLCGGAHWRRDCPQGRKNQISVLIGEEVLEEEEEAIEAFMHGTSASPMDRYCCTVTIEGREAKGLRDTGATHTQVVAKLVPKHCYTGKTKRVRYANNFAEDLPTAVVKLETPYYSGNVEVLVAKDSPVPVLIGNANQVPEREHDQVKPLTPVQEETRHTQKPKPTEMEDRVVPTQQAPCEHGTQTITQAVEVKAAISSTSDPQPGTSTETETKIKEQVPLKVKQTALADVTPAMLKAEQEKDSTLEVPLKHARMKTEAKRRSNGVWTQYYMKKGILHREYKDHHRTIKQIVVPKKYRVKIMEVAHDPPMAAHMGVARTKQRIIENFYWPGIDAEVRRFCLSCDKCQRNTPKGKMRNAPLQHVPIVTTPFEQVAVDIIGPINPTSTNGNRYVVTMVDYATRYAEATAIPKIDSATVAEALFDMWSRLGIPERVISDRGTQFTSEIMKEVYRLLSIKGLYTTPYHAQANGLVERFNGTLKSMIHKLCIEQPTEWDRLLPAMLFAYREVPQESTRFSPFELLYGRQVKGPLFILKRAWTSDESDDAAELRTTAQYITDLRNKIEETCKIASENQKEAKRRYTEVYDRKAVKRNLKAGESVLVLLPDKHKRLQLSWQGPHLILKKINEVDYVIRIGKKEKIYHVNLIKKYHERQNEEGEEEIMVVVPEEPDVEFVSGAIPAMPLTQTESYDDAIISDELSQNQKKQVQDLLKKHQKTMSDLPGTTQLVECTLQLTTEEPIRVNQYPLPLSQIKVVEEEVREMEKMGVIRKCVSPYNAPVVLVTKKSGAIRFCTDFRRLNAATKFDAEPMPNIDEIFSRVGKAKYLSKLDLCKGFWQIPMKESDQDKTAFSTPLGQYCWLRMPFGMKNASAVFTRMMRKLLGPLQSKDVNNFIDDILVSNEDWSEHIQTVDKVMQRIEEEGLTAKPSKCCFGFYRLSFLGHMVGGGSMQPEQDKVDKLMKAERPKTKKQARAFLGLAGYYRRFIKNFTQIATPLTEATKKGKPDKIAWDEDMEKAFQTLKNKLASKPVIVLPDPDKQFVLRTDASDYGLGAVLLQEHGDTLRPVAYASKKLLKAERNYATIEKECLGVVWAVKKFDPYIFGTHFILETDHRPLEYLKRSRTDNGRLMRWALQLQQYTFTLRVIPGIDNIGADYMSRI